MAGIFVAQGAAMTFSKLSQLQIQKKSLKSDINLKRISSISLPSQGITKSSTNKMINIPKNFDVNDELLYWKNETVKYKGNFVMFWGSAI